MIDENKKKINIKKFANKLKFADKYEIKEIIKNILETNDITLIIKYVKLLEIIVNKRKDMKSSLSKLLYGSAGKSMDGLRRRRSSKRRSSKRRSSKRRSSKRRSTKRRSTKRRS